MKKLFILGTLCLLFTISAVSQTKKEWEKVQSLNSWNAYQQFIQNYPNGKYTEEAKQKQSLVERPEPVIKVEENKDAQDVPADKSIGAASADSLKSGSQILIKKGRYYVDDKPLTNKELKTLLKSDPESAVFYKKAKTTAAIGYVLEGVTILLLMPTVGILPGIIGGLLVATPFIIVSSKQSKKALQAYNSKRGGAPELKK